MIKEKSKIWQYISKQIGLVFSKLPFPPNFYTWLTLPFALLGMLAMKRETIGLAILLFVISGLLDLIDGAVARQLNKTSGKGAFLDGSLDRFVDCMLLFSYFQLPIQTLWLTLGQWLFMTLFFAIMPSFLVAYANHRRAVDDPNEVIIWRILNRGEMYVWMLSIPIVSQYNPLWAGYLLMGLVAVSAITTLQAVSKTLFLANKEQSYEEN